MTKPSVLAQGRHEKDIAEIAEGPAGGQLFDGADGLLDVFILPTGATNKPPL